MKSKTMLVFVGIKKRNKGNNQEQKAPFFCGRKPLWQTKFFFYNKHKHDTADKNINCDLIMSTYFWEETMTTLFSFFISSKYN